MLNELNIFTLWCWTAAVSEDYVVLIHFMNSLSPSTWLNHVNGRIIFIQSLQKQFPLDRAVSKSSNKSPEQLQRTYAWHEWRSIFFFECCCFLPLHTHVGHVLWYTIIKKKKLWTNCETMSWSNRKWQDYVYIQCELWIECTKYVIRSVFSGCIKCLCETWHFMKNASGYFTHFSRKSNR